MDELLAEAAKLAGRPVFVVPTKDNKYVVEYFNYNLSPPVGSTPTEALILFVNKLKENTYAVNPEPIE